MRPTTLLVALPLLLVACGGASESRPRSSWPPPNYAPVQSEPVRPVYAMPWMVGMPAQPPTFAPAGPALTVAPAVLQAGASRDKCLSDAGTVTDCESALHNLAASQSAAPLYDVYKKACERKAKLLGCGVFKSTAVSESDRPQVELLMHCEAGLWESCEEVSTKSAPLQAWHSTLKAEGCKKGQSALCKNYKECRGKTEWGCKAAGATPTAGGAPPKEVCGCIPKSCGGPLTVTPSPTAKTWPDGTQRGSFSCAP